MFELTPGERRGAIVLLLIVLIGAAWDLAGGDPPMAPAVRERPPAAGGGSGGAGGAAPGTSSAAPAAPAGPVNLNTATARELDALPGIGPVLAGRIVEHRRAHGPFASVDELLAVRGIGPRSFERLRPLVTAARAGRIGRGDSLQIARPE